MPKPLICDLPYPSADTLTEDVQSGQIISFAYATLGGELNAILQYMYHSFRFGQFNADYASVMEQIAVAEMKHLDILGNAMLKLGVDPIYRQIPKTPNVWYNTSCIAYSKTTEKMLMDDIEGELNAIADYKKMLFVLKNEQVEAIIQRIILDEELHVEKLKSLLKRHNDKTANA